MLEQLPELKVLPLGQKDHHDERVLIMLGNQYI